MALWQYSFFVIPRSPQLENIKLPAELAGTDQIEVIGWGDAAKVAIFQRSLDNLLHRKGSWDADSINWGEDGGDEVSIRHGHLPFEMRVRLDLRAPNRFLIDGLIQSINEIGAWILDETGSVYEPNHANFKTMAKRSPAFKFAHNPRAFLSELDASSEQ